MNKEQKTPVKSRKEWQEKRRKAGKKRKLVLPRKKKQSAAEKKPVKEGRTSKRRKSELDQYKETDKKLTIAIAVTAVLLAIALLLVFFV
ncbi:hypothetical protein [Atopococcus tabaci]|uniref:hypothetical protein n=1 Tax=Atopococcus tabaci TaxID=269774 RepID=UPI0004128538|nr:hypothetical protein [Atopococcus tabaci]